MAAGASVRTTVGAAATVALATTAGFVGFTGAAVGAAGGLDGRQDEGGRRGQPAMQVVRPEAGCRKVRSSASFMFISGFL